ncbi:hypothetical protein PMAYCL1PPCAC_22048, partial [Pristionchus mayeri]
NIYSVSTSYASKDTRMSEMGMFRAISRYKNDNLSYDERMEFNKSFETSTVPHVIFNEMQFTLQRFELNELILVKIRIDDSFISHCLKWINPPKRLR